MGAAGNRGLLERYQPALRYDSNETFFADAVEIMAGANDAFELTRGSGELILPGPVDPAVLASASYGDGGPVNQSDRLGATRRDYREQAYELHPDPGLRNVTYAHAQTDSDGRLWL